MNWAGVRSWFGYHNEPKQQKKELSFNDNVRKLYELEDVTDNDISTTNDEIQYLNDQVSIKLDEASVYAIKNEDGANSNEYKTTVREISSLETQLEILYGDQDNLYYQKRTHNKSIALLRQAYMSSKRMHIKRKINAVISSTMIANTETDKREDKEIMENHEILNGVLNPENEISVNEMDSMNVVHNKRNQSITDRIQQRSNKMKRAIKNKKTKKTAMMHRLALDMDGASVIAVGKKKKNKNNNTRKTKSIKR